MSSKRVLVFGSFDGIHEGHRHVFKEASKLGDELYVVVALDETIQAVKKKKPLHDESSRLSHVQGEKYVTKAILGNKGDKHAILKEIFPDVICLGYDQEHFTEDLSKSLSEFGLKTDIVRLQPFHPEKYKSSILNAGSK